MSTETPTPGKRPWESVAPWPETADLTAMRAHYAAMAWAHMLGYQRDLSEATHHTEEPEELRTRVRQANARHGDPMAAAFTAAAQAGGYTMAEAARHLLDADLTNDTLYDWLRAAGINPDEIEAAP